MIVGKFYVEDAKFMEDMLQNMKGEREFVVKPLLEKYDILFDT
jgi:hypothetical protein